MATKTECSEYFCGHDAVCIVTPDGPTCKCPPGLLGNPFPGGDCVTDQCSPTRPCADAQVCIGGRCKHQCENVVCGVGATCNPSNGRCVCEPNFVGNPDLLCMPRKLNFSFIAFCDNSCLFQTQLSHLHCVNHLAVKMLIVVTAHFPINVHVIRELLVILTNLVDLKGKPHVVKRHAELVLSVVKMAQLLIVFAHLAMLVCDVYKIFSDL